MKEKRNTHFPTNLVKKANSFSFVHSYLNYENIAWRSSTQTKQKKLERKQKQAIRIIHAAEYTREKIENNQSFEYLQI